MQKPTNKSGKPAPKSNDKNAKPSKRPTAEKQKIDAKANKAQLKKGKPQ